MVTFDEFVSRFLKLGPFIKKRSKELLVQNGEQIKEMVKEQHHAGVNRDNKKMQSGYSPGYAKRRKKKGLQTSFVDLHFTGKYHKTLDIVPVKDGVDVQSTEPYAYYLRGSFPKMAGLTPKNAELMSEVIARLLAVEIKKYLVA